MERDIVKWNAPYAGTLAVAIVLVGLAMGCVDFVRNWLTHA